jgi:hypothetical protein
MVATLCFVMCHYKFPIANSRSPILLIPVWCNHGDDVTTTLQYNSIPTNFKTILLSSNSLKQKAACKQQTSIYSLLLTLLQQCNTIYFPWCLCIIYNKSVWGISKGNSVENSPPTTFSVRGSIRTESCGIPLRCVCVTLR